MWLTQTIRTFEIHSAFHITKASKGADDFRVEILAQFIQVLHGAPGLHGTLSNNAAGIFEGT